ncbi:hypothetical protein BH09PLA1_BH09PLA1_25950 [soil metagenome]
MTPDSEKIAVFLNGEARPQCIRANARQRWCTSQILGDNGRVIFDGLGRRKTITEQGKVELRREFA